MFQERDSQVKEAHEVEEVDVEHLKIHPRKVNINLKPVSHRLHQRQDSLKDLDHCREPAQVE